MMIHTMKSATNDPTLLGQVIGLCDISLEKILLVEHIQLNSRIPSNPRSSRDSQAPYVMLGYFYTCLFHLSFSEGHMT